MAAFETSHKLEIELLLGLLVKPVLVSTLKLTCAPVLLPLLCCCFACLMLAGFICVSSNQTIVWPLCKLLRSIVLEARIKEGHKVVELDSAAQTGT